MHSNIGSCAMFAATSGSSVATAATIGTVALPQARRAATTSALFLGTLAAGGTLGILIPPSINLILYGLLTNYVGAQALPRRHRSGVRPGVLLHGDRLRRLPRRSAPRAGPGGDELEPAAARAAERDLLPPLIFLVVVGSIYAGIATPTEAASLGVIAALLLAAWERR